jgi:hypothetical protein
MPSDHAVVAGLGVRTAAASQAQNYWREEVIPTVHYSPSGQ